MGSLGSFVKGYAFSDEKLASKFDFDKSDMLRANVFIETIIEQMLPRSAYLCVTPAYQENKDGTKTLIVVIVLDDGYDKDSLRDKPLPDLDPSIERIKAILDGPDVWERL